MLEIAYRLMIVDAKDKIWQAQTLFENQSLLYFIIEDYGKGITS